MNLEFRTGDKPEYFGNHILIGLSGLTLDDTDKRMLAKVKPAGILLLKRNFDHASPYEVWLPKLQALLAAVRNYAEREELFVTIDHEGGRVMRTPPPLTAFPAPAKYGARAAEVGTAIGIELRSIGVNVDWAPLADIHSNPTNPVIGDRSFGSDPETVGRQALSFAQALMAQGVLGCAKHFPGHGDTSVDSHLELPTLDLTTEQLKHRELIPFRALVESDIPFVMTAHILFPKIDPRFPATLSPRILGELLREGMGFRNVIIGDDLDMKAIAQRFDANDTVALAMNAGCDMFCIARYPDGTSERPLHLARSMASCLAKKILTEERLFESFERIRRIAARLTPSVVTPLDGAVFTAHARLKAELS
jgi:beta-N-acetylhexosaminidase